MDRRMCDVCKTRDASKSFKVKESHMLYGFSKDWNPYRKIDICDSCAEKLLNIESYRMIRLIEDQKRAEYKI